MDRWPEVVRALITRRPLAAAHEVLVGKPSGIKHVITVEEATP